MYTEYQLQSTSREAIIEALESTGMRDTGSDADSYDAYRCWSQVRQIVYTQEVTDEQGTVTSPAVKGGYICDIKIKDGGPTFDPGVVTQLWTPDGTRPSHVDFDGTEAGAQSINKTVLTMTSGTVFIHPDDQPLDSPRHSFS